MLCKFAQPSPRWGIIAGEESTRMTETTHVQCSVCGDKITVRVQDQQDQRLTKRGYTTENIAALSPLCQKCCSRAIRTGQSLEYLRQCHIEHQEALAQSFHDLLKSERLTDTQRHTIETVIQEVIRLAREYVPGRDTTTGANSTTERATLDARGLGDDNTNDIGTGRNS